MVAHSGAAGRSGNCRRLARRAAGLRTGEPVREATVDERGTRPDRIVVSIDLMSLLDARERRTVFGCETTRLRRRPTRYQRPFSTSPPRSTRYRARSTRCYGDVLGLDRARFRCPSSDIDIYPYRALQ